MREAITRRQTALARRVLEQGALATTGTMLLTNLAKVDSIKEDSVANGERSSSTGQEESRCEGFASLQRYGEKSEDYGRRYCCVHQDSRPDYRGSRELRAKGK